ncbi:hypothetical protein ACIO1C_29570 [Streptomyces sp. NPDC087420]|uniref:hypothetical protein n=1 Tax=Streptomyces sp. NPDC087420 TaxID=3365785 RepID=UPI003837458F
MAEGERRERYRTALVRADFNSPLSSVAAEAVMAVADEEQRGLCGTIEAIKRSESALQSYVNDLRAELAVVRRYGIEEETD